MATKTKSQIHFDDRIIDNPELEKLLDERQDLKQYTKQYRQADKKAKDKIREISEQTPYRVGRYIISKDAVAARSVSFETADSSRITIKTVGEE